MLATITGVTEQDKFRAMILFFLGEFRVRMLNFWGLILSTCGLFQDVECQV